MTTATDTTAGTRQGRRGFLRWVFGLAAASTVGIVVTPVVAFLLPGRSAEGGDTGKVDAGKVADLPAGKGKVVAMGSKPVIVVGTADGPKAYSAICTHLGCIVAYDEASSLIVCPCHGGEFSPANGAVVGGPPPAPLATVKTSVEKDEIYLVAG